jgi:flagellar hook-basal body complex protein FliE
MSVSGIEAIGGFTPFVPQTAEATTGLGSVAGAARPSAPQAADGPDFGNLVLDGLERLEGVQKQSDALAVKAATGDLQSIHDYTIAATQAQVTTQVTVAIRNKAVEAFNEIMRMPV